MNRSRLWYSALAVAAATFLSAPFVAGQVANGLLRACVGASGGSMRLLLNPADNCRSTERLVTWNQVGPAGPVGPAGAPGPVGPAGPAGPSGAAAVAQPATPVIGRITFRALPGGGSTADAAAAPALVSELVLPITGLTFGAVNPSAHAWFPPRPTGDHLFDFLTVEMPIGRQTPRLLEQVTTGSVQGGVLVELCRAPECGASKYLDYELKSAVIGSIHQGTGNLDNTLLEQIDLQFSTAHWTAYENGAAVSAGSWEPDRGVRRE